MALYIDNIAKPARTLTELEQKLLLKVTGEHARGFRDHCIFSMAIGTGLREHEILALNMGDVYGEDGHARRRIQLKVFKRSRSDSDGQEVVLPDLVRTKLDKFRRLKKTEGQSLEPDAPLFMSSRRKRLSTRQLRELFHVWQERAGFERRFNFHALRHTACTNLYRKSRDIRLTQRFARHASVLTTSIYAHPSDEDLLRAVRDMPC